MRSANNPVTHSSNMAAIAPLAVAWAIAVAAGAQAQGNQGVATGERGNGHYADVNGIKPYYEIHGSPDTR